MKKCSIIALSLAILILTSCTVNQKNTITTNDDTMLQELPVEQESNAGLPDSTNLPVDSDKPAENDEETSAFDQISFEKTTVIDNEECSLIISEIDFDDYWGCSLKVQLENKSSDVTYMFSLDNMAINGVECASLFATEVMPGKKANDDITVFDSTLTENGIQEYSDIELSFRVYDSNDWSADNIAEETVHIYPYGEDKAELYTREKQSTDTVLVDNDSVSATVIGFREDEIWGYCVDLFLENHTSEEIMFSVQDASVNGYMADPFFAATVSAGKCAFKSISWSNPLLEENKIATVDEIEFTIRSYSCDNWAANDYANETVILNP